jgi:probable HAF family extracellular repeat protein
MVGGMGTQMIGAIGRLRVRRAAVFALAAAALAPATLAGGSDAAVSAFPPLDMGTLGGDSSAATAINDSGQVVGWSRIAPNNPTYHAFLWTPADRMIDLGSFGGNSYAVSVNEAGNVAGWSETAAGVEHAFFWSAATGMVDLGTLGVDSRAANINDAGTVVGHGTTTTGATRAFAWLRTTGMVDLGTLGGDYAVAADVSNAGEVVGSSANASGERRAFLWTQTGGMIDLGADFWSTAHAVSDAGEVVGTRSNRAFSWTKAGGIVDLDGGASFFGSTPVAVNNAGQITGQWIGWKTSATCLVSRAGTRTCFGYLGGPSSSPADLNEAGQVVGSSSLFFFGPGTHAFLWTRPLGTVDLGTLGGLSSVATDINNLGQIVGSSEVAGAGEPVLRATVWDVPAPPSPPPTVTATAGDGLARVGFAPAAFAGDSPIAHYTATAWPGGQSASGTSSPITVAGLENGTSYTFTVTATNAFDASPPSVPSNAVVPEGSEREHPDPPAEGPRAAVPEFAPVDAPRPRPPGR